MGFSKITRNFEEYGLGKEIHKYSHLQPVYLTFPALETCLLSLLLTESEQLTG